MQHCGINVQDVTKITYDNEVNHVFEIPPRIDLKEKKKEKKERKKKHIHKHNYNVSFFNYCNKIKIRIFDSLFFCYIK